jgi:hypothetical protein
MGLLRTVELRCVVILVLTGEYGVGKKICIFVGSQNAAELNEMNDIVFGFFLGLCFA